MGGFAVPVGGQTYLQSAPAGPARLLWHGAESGGYYWAVVTLGAGLADVCWVELTADLAAFGSTTARALEWTGSAYTKGTADVTVYDVMGLSASSGAKLPVAWSPQNGRLEVLAVVPPAGLIARLQSPSYSPANLLYYTQEVTVTWGGSAGDSLASMGLELSGGTLKSTSGGRYLCHLYADLVATNDWPTTEYAAQNTTYNSEPPDAHVHQYNYRLNHFLLGKVQAVNVAEASFYLKYINDSSPGGQPYAIVTATGLWLPAVNDMLTVKATVKSQGVPSPAGATFVDCKLVVERF